jgi:hypothetical protein
MSTYERFIEGNLPPGELFGRELENDEKSRLNDAFDEFRGSKGIDIAASQFRRVRGIGQVSTKAEAKVQAGIPVVMSHEQGRPGGKLQAYISTMRILAQTWDLKTPSLAYIPKVTEVLKSEDGRVVLLGQKLDWTNPRHRTRLALPGSEEQFNILVGEKILNPATQHVAVYCIAIADGVNGHLIDEARYNSAELVANPLNFTPEFSADRQRAEELYGGIQFPSIKDQDQLGLPFSE